MVPHYLGGNIIKFCRDWPQLCRLKVPRKHTFFFVKTKKEHPRKHMAEMRNVVWYLFKNLVVFQNIFDFQARILAIRKQGRDVTFFSLAFSWAILSCWQLSESCAMVFSYYLLGSLLYLLGSIFYTLSAALVDLATLVHAGGLAAMTKTMCAFFLCFFSGRSGPTPPEDGYGWNIIPWRWMVQIIFLSTWVMAVGSSG